MMVSMHYQDYLELKARADPAELRLKNEIATAICHWPGCTEEFPPKLWGCRRHWFMLPKQLRDSIWSTYRPGQEIDKNPSHGYLIAAQHVQKWIRENYGDG